METRHGNRENTWATGKVRMVKDGRDWTLVMADERGRDVVVAVEGGVERLIATCEGYAKDFAKMAEELREYFA